MSTRLDLDNIPNLDAQTLRWAAELVREEGYRSRECLLQYAMNEEKRKPDLADWVSVACRSKLGEPAYSFEDYDEPGATLSCQWRHPVNVTAEIYTKRQGAGIYAPDGWREMSTPHDLRIELNRIADMVGEDE